MAEAARASERVLVEAFHWRYHPLAARMREILASGEIGRVQHLEAWLCFPMLSPRDIRWRLDLAGGALMDAGCYPVSMVRHLAKATDEKSEPEVVSAHSWLRSPGVDRRTEAEMRFADGRTGKIGCSMLSRTLLWTSILARGEEGEMRVANPIAPHFWHRLRVRNASGTRSERVRGDATYTHQLRAFVDAVRRGTPVPTDPRDAIANMRAIDAIYRAAGLPPRGT
jgi:predicted dehydrogenase